VAVTKRQGMKNKDQERGKYFREISHYFLNMRGSPFFLSSRDIDHIASWEQMGIPFSVVIDGIERTFEKSRTRMAMKGKRKFMSLSFCEYHVLQAYEQYKEKRVGDRIKNLDRDNKRKRVRKEVQIFLKSLPPQLEFVREAFIRARSSLFRKQVDEDKLEKLEMEIEKFLVENCPEEDRKSAVQAVLEEYPSLEGEDFQSFVQTKLVKYLRDKYKIPYISLFYY
jgi:hypothetical protein